MADPQTTTNEQPKTDNRQPTTDHRLIMGTRGSPLALAQSRLVAAALSAVHPGLVIEEKVIRTTGDRMQTEPLPVIGGKGVFTKEIEQALLDEEIDFAVHSLKDLPPHLPEGLCIGAIPRRETASDVCILHPAWREWPVEKNKSDEEPGESQNPSQSRTNLSFLPLGARIGTSSLRRQAQLLHLRSDLHIENLRGNIDTRLRKLEEENFHAIVLARSGLQRLGSEAQLSAQRIFRLNEHDFVPAPGQGALAIEARAGDQQVLDILRAVDDDRTRAEITAERSAMRALNAGCSTPLGARAIVAADAIELWAVILSPDGTQWFCAEDCGPVSAAVAVGESVAQQLIGQGATELFEKSV